MKPRLVTHTGERIVVDSMAQLEQRRAEILERHAKELQEIDDKIGTIKLQEVEALKKQAASLGFSVTPKANHKSDGKRRPVTCSLCRKYGLSREGHTARSHDSWLTSQSLDIQKQFG